MICFHQKMPSYKNFLQYVVRISAVPREVKAMKRILRSMLVCLCFSAFAGYISAQTPGGTSVPTSVKVFPRFNPPPCDFSDLFYEENGIDPTQLVGRFGTNRQFGPPAVSQSQANWVADNTCGANDPTRRNFRILATTGAFKDDDGAPTQFFSLLAFLVNQTNFETTFSKTVGGSTISIADSLNPRGISMQSLVGNFEAYGAPTQKMANGKLAPTPCGTLHDPGIAANDCFAIGKEPNGTFSVETPNLRHDWRIASNRNAMDGSDNNCINTDPSVCAVFSDSPFGYFCDDLLGMWIVTYFWWSQFAIGGTDSSGQPITPTANCNKVLAAFASVNGTSLDGTPIVKTGDQLHFIEGVPGTPASVIGGGLSDSDLPPSTAPCGVEGQLDPAGSDGGAIWLICPTIQDPRNGAIAKDAFLDVVRLQNGNAQNTDLLNNFSCLQNTGKFCNESAPGF